MPLRDRENERPGLRVVVSADRCDAIGGLAKYYAGLSGVVVSTTPDGGVNIRLDEPSAERWYAERMAEWEADQHSVWSALRAKPKPERRTELLIFSGVVQVICEPGATPAERK